jgi:hypothetical protein
MDISETLTWGPPELQTDILEIGIGTGKKNTESIIDKLEQYNFPRTAAVVCWTMESNGYRDWYLPSIGELELLYQNLFRARIGGFNASNVYWSSTGPGWLSNNTIVARTVRAILFENGGKGNVPQTNKESVRPIRSF